MVHFSLKTGIFCVLKMTFSWFKGWNSFVIHHFEIFILSWANLMAKSAGISKLVDETAVSSIKPWKSQFYINFIFSLHKFSNSILVNYSSTKWNLKWNRQWIWEFRQSKRGCLCIRKKVHFKGKIEPSF